MNNEMEFIKSGISNMGEDVLTAVAKAAGIHTDQGPKHMRERLLGLTPKQILAAVFKSGVVR